MCLSRGHIRSKLRHSLATKTLERYVRTYRNMRLRDRVKGRGVKAQKRAMREQAEPKPYPLAKGHWSSCDESEEDAHWDAITATMGF